MVDQSFVQRLKKVYSIYTGGLITLLILLYIGEKLFGLSPTFIGYVFLFGTIAVYAAIGIISRTGNVAEYYVAGRRVPAVFNGMATAADWMSAASFIGMAGALALQGYNGLAFIMGWTGGYVLLGVLIAPYLRKFGAYTVPDFLDARYGGKIPRFVGIVATIMVSFTYLVAQITGVGIITSRLLGLPFEVGVFVGLAGILVCSFLGGMRAVTWTQVAQYIVLIIAYLIPVTVLSFKYTGNPISQISYGFALQEIDKKLAQIKEDPKEQEVREIHKKKAEELKAKIAALPQSWEEGRKKLEEQLASLPEGDPRRKEIEKQLKEYPKSPEEAKKKWTEAMKKAEAASKPPKPYTQPPQTAKDMANFLALMLMLMLGTAGLPHVIMRFYTTPTVREARTSAGWALFFILLLYITAPAYAAFGRYEILNLVGKSFAELPGWVQKWAVVNLITVKDLNGDGIIQFGEISIHPDMVVLATPEIAGLPYVIAGFVAAGGLAAALSTADGLLITISNAISHDLYYKIINPNISPSTRVKIGKALLLIVALIGAWVASFRLAIIVELVAWAFSLAASSLFPVLVLGIWDKRTNKYGAVAGMIVGLVVTLAYMIASRFYGFELFGIKTIAAGIFGMPLNFIVTYVVSRLTPPPPQQLQEFVDHIRYPKGAVKAGAEE